MKVKLVYFAWVRERIGVADEVVDIPADVTSGKDLIAWLSARGENYAYAFEQADAIRIAVDQELLPSQHDTMGDAREIALFPPMTGG